MIDIPPLELLGEFVYVRQRLFSRQPFEGLWGRIEVNGFGRGVAIYTRKYFINISGIVE